MSKKLEPCPFCGGEVRIIVCDDEGNHHTPDYEDDPWSGLGFMLYHDEESNPDCPIAHEVWGQCGRTIYDTREEAADAWNRRASGLTPDELPRAAELVRAEKEGKLHIGRCLECKEYEGLAVCSLIGDCGGTNFHCGWFAPRAEAEAALQKGAGGQ